MTQHVPLTSRRALLGGVLGTVLLGASACGSSTSDTGSAAAASSSGPATSSGTGSATAAAATAESPDLETLVSQVQGAFKQYEYSDSETGKSLPYNLFVPAGYDASTSYPLVLYIADSSLAGKDVTASLSQYGALVWAGSSEQAKHESIVLVPAYPSVIIDDHGSYTTTEYVEMTGRLLDAVKSEYSVDGARVYGTGQSMGCMTVMYLAAKHPDMFAAELFVSGQWDASELGNLAKEKFCYIAAGGDDKASAGQAEVEQLLTSAGVPHQTATWDATWSAAEFTAAAQKLFAAGDAANFATFATGTVLQVSGSSSSPVGGEHMASFEPAYKIAPLRDWLFEQRA